MRGQPFLFDITCIRSMSRQQYRMDPRLDVRRSLSLARPCLGVETSEPGLAVGKFRDGDRD